MRALLIISPFNSIAHRLRSDLYKGQSNSGLVGGERNEESIQFLFIVFQLAVRIKLLFGHFQCLFYSHSFALNFSAGEIYGGYDSPSECSCGQMGLEFQRRSKFDMQFRNVVVSESDKCVVQLCIACVCVCVCACNCADEWE